MSFKVGDVVWLKSGGARMTVSGLEHDGQCRCVWHDRTPDIVAESSGVYAQEMLTDVEPSVGSPPASDAEYKVYAEGDD